MTRHRSVLTGCGLAAALWLASPAEVSAAPPGVPRDVSAAADVHAIVLTWRGPADNGGSPVTLYGVYRADSAAGPLVRKALLKAYERNRYVEYGLEPGATFHYAVAAVNGSGAGDVSPRVVGQAGGAPVRYTAIESVAGKIWDVSSTRILFVRPPNPDVLLRQKNLGSGAIRSIPLPLGTIPARGYLAPRGAIYVAGGRVREAEPASAAITDLGKILNPYWLTVEGGHATWRTGADAWYRNLVSKTKQRVTLAPGSFPGGLELAANGDLVINEQSPSSRRVWRHRNGALTDLGEGYGPETDGVDVLLLKQTVTGRTAIILFHEGVRVPGAVHLQVRPDFPSMDVASGWIAYSRYPADSAAAGIWLRDPSGVEQQVSGTTASGPIYALSPEGDVMYRGANGHVYLGRHGLPPLDLGLDYFDYKGRGGGDELEHDGNWVFSESGAWYAVVGGTLFALDTQAPSSPIQTLSEPGVNALSLRVGIDASGNAVVAWRRSGDGRMQTRARAAAGGVLSPIQTLSEDGTQDRPGLAVDPAGNAVFTWRRLSNVETRARAGDGTLSAIQTLSTPGALGRRADVGVGADGTAVFAWIQGADRLHTRERSAAGTLGPVQEVPSSDIDFAARDPRVAVDAGGNAAFIWRYGASINIATRAADGTLSPTENPSSGDHAQVAIDPAGNAVFVWRVSGRIRYQARAADGTLSDVEYLTEGGQNAHLPQVGMDAGGNAVFTWRSTDGTNWRIQARARAADGTLGPVEDLSPPGAHAHEPQVAVDPGGMAVFTWRRFDGHNSRIQARTRAADGTLGLVEDVSAAGIDAFEPQVAVDPAGNAIFAWRLRDGTNSLVQARARPVE